MLKAAATFLFTGLGLMTVSTVANAVKIDMQDYKSNTHIVEDAKHFGADLQVANYFADKLSMLKIQSARLPHNNDKPIYVGVSNDFDKTEKEMINDALNYYEDLFSNINNHYRFSIVDLTEAYLQSAIGQNTLMFYKKDLSATGYHGLNTYIPNLFNAEFSKNSLIVINNDPTLDNQVKYYTIMHELAHSFGLGDVYGAEDVQFYGTFMRQNIFTNEIKMLFPNDVAILYAMYGESYRNGNEIDDAKLSQAKQSFEDYKKLFYEKTLNIMKERFVSSTDNISEIEQEVLANKSFNFAKNIFNEKTGEGKRFYYAIKIDDEKTATFSEIDKQGNVLWQTETNYVNFKGAIILPSVCFSEGRLYSGKSSETNNKGIDFFVIAKFSKRYYLQSSNDDYSFNLTLKNVSAEAQSELTNF